MYGKERAREIAYLFQEVLKTGSSQRYTLSLTLEAGKIEIL